MPNLVLYVQPAFRVPNHAPCSSGSPFAIKLERLLRYKRLPFRIDEVGWLERQSRLPTLSSSGKLPVLEYDGERLEDSTAIAYFLELRHPNPRLVPEDAVARAQMHFLEEWADEALYFYGIHGSLRPGGSTTIPYLSRPLPEGERETVETGVRAYLDGMLVWQGVGRYPIEKVDADLSRSLDALAALVARSGFAVGADLTLADLALFGQIARYFLSGTQPDFERQIHIRPQLVAWYHRVDSATRDA